MKILKIRLGVFYIFFAITCTSCARQEEHVLRVLNHSPVVSLDPQTTDDFVSLSVLSNVYETLVSYNQDLQVVPMLATSLG